MDSTGNGAIDRRSAIKKGVAAAGVAGVVWSAPKIEGLSLRPNYAAAASGIASFNFVVPINAVGNVQSTVMGSAGFGGVLIGNGSVTGNVGFGPASAVDVTINAFNQAANATASLTSIDFNADSDTPFFRAKTAVTLTCT